MYGIRYEHDSMTGAQLDARWDRLMKMWREACKAGDTAGEMRASKELDHIEFEWERRSRALAGAA